MLRRAEKQIRHPALPDLLQCVLPGRAPQGARLGKAHALLVPQNRNAREAHAGAGHRNHQGWHRH